MGNGAKLLVKLWEETPRDHVTAWPKPWPDPVLQDALCKAPNIFISVNQIPLLILH